MLCPACGFDNIDGVDDCEQCAQPLVEFDPTGGELEESISRHKVDVLCPKDPLTITPETTVRDAVAEMVGKRIGCLFVVQNDELTGVFTERDVLLKVSSDLEALDCPVTDFMTPSPVTISKEDSIAYALHLMDLGGYRHLGIVAADGRPTGVISIRDILRFLCVRFGEIRTQAS